MTGTVQISGSRSPIRVPKIVCVGRNYREHAAEMKVEVPIEPVLFLKPPTAIVHDGQPIVRPPFSAELHYEAEMVVLVGKGGRNLDPERAWDHVAGYGIGLDMTLRDVQAAAKAKGLPWAVAKGFDTSAPVSTFVSAADLGPRPVFDVTCLVNGAVRQKGSTAAMIFDVGRLLAFISTIFTLEEGDLVFTGTPEGVGPVAPGDVIEARLGDLCATRHTIAGAARG